MHIYRGADKSLARPGRKQATAIKLLQATQKKFRRLSVQPRLRGRNGLCVGRKMATFQLFFQSVRAKELSETLYNKIHILSKLSYMFRRLLPHFQVEFERTLRTTVIFFGYTF